MPSFPFDQGEIQMRRSTELIVLATLIAGSLAIFSALIPPRPGNPVKTDRLSGEQTQTAFLPERFGVASSRQ
jgi:hypothetical protein